MINKETAARAVLKDRLRILKDRLSKLDAERSEVSGNIKMVEMCLDYLSTERSEAEAVVSKGTPIPASLKPEDLRPMGLKQSIVLISEVNGGMLSNAGAIAVLVQADMIDDTRDGHRKVWNMSRQLQEEGTFERVAKGRYRLTARPAPSGTSVN